MAHKAPGKQHREGISLMKLFKMFPDNSAAEKWFARTRWPEDPNCPHCESVNVQSGAAHKSMPYRCREHECRKPFSVRSHARVAAARALAWSTRYSPTMTSVAGMLPPKFRK